MGLETGMTHDEIIAYAINKWLLQDTTHDCKGVWCVPCMKRRQIERNNRP